MYFDDVFFGEMANNNDELDEFLDNVRDRMDSYQLGHFEDDPNMSEYEDLVDLGMSLAVA